MQKESHVLLNSIHRYFGVEFNNRIWPYFEMEKLTEEDKDDMIAHAHAAYLHWKMHDKCTTANIQRAYYMLGKVYVKADKQAEAIHYAHQCMTVTNNNKADMKDFDIAYAYELMARVDAMLGNRESFEKHYGQAQEAGNNIADAEDKKYFVKDLSSRPWFGMK